MSQSTLDTLPIEIVLLVLEKAHDPAHLLAIAGSCRIFLAVFLRYRDILLVQALQKAIPNAKIRAARAACCNIPLPNIDLSEDASANLSEEDLDKIVAAIVSCGLEWLKNVEQEYEGDKGGIQREQQTSSQDPLSRLCSVWSVANNFIPTYEREAQEDLERFAKILDNFEISTSRLPKSQLFGSLSRIERARVQRALFWFVFFQRLECQFRPVRLYGWVDSLTTLQDIFYNSLSKGMREEFRCIGSFIIAHGLSLVRGCENELQTFFQQGLSAVQTVSIRPLNSLEDSEIYYERDLKLAIWDHFQTLAPFIPLLGLENLVKLEATNMAGRVPLLKTLWIETFHQLCGPFATATRFSDHHHWKFNCRVVEHAFWDRRRWDWLGQHNSRLIAKFTEKTRERKKASERFSNSWIIEDRSFLSLLGDELVDRSLAKTTKYGCLNVNY